MSAARIPFRSLAVASLLGALFMTGCDEARITGTAIETEDANFVEGRRLRDAGQYRESLDHFTKVILSRASAPESHLEAGNICLDSPVKDPLQAIFHFRQYVRESALEKSDPARLGYINGRIRSAERDFILNPALPFRPSEIANYDRSADQLEKLKALREENDALKRRVSELTVAASKPASVVIRSSEDEDPAPASTGTAAAAVTPAPSVTPPAARPAASSRSYTVAPGDTLSKIARKMYGSTARWKDIQNANQDKLGTGVARLKVGVTLVIPE